MPKYVTTEHVLETSTNGMMWHRADAGMYAEAQVLAYHGEAERAIALAEEIRIKEYGHMRDVDFRVVTTSRTVTYHGLMTEFVMSK